MGGLVVQVKQNFVQRIGLHTWYVFNPVAHSINSSKFHFTEQSLCNETHLVGFEIDAFYLGYVPNP
jgi:hypothetical protein